MRRLLITTLVTIGLGFVSMTPVCARDGIVVDLKAMPSEDCFPASALQLPELKEDLARICSDCVFDGSRFLQPDFSLVVEDPDYSWKFSLYDGNGALIKQMKWHGSLQSGLSKAVELMRQKVD